jgi:hypothetical protein
MPDEARQMEKAPKGALSICAPGGIRTPNLLIRSQMLYPLSYGRSVENNLISIAQNIRREKTRDIKGAGDAKLAL